MQTVQTVKDQIQSQSHIVDALAWREEKELAKILWPNETILSSVFGRSAEHQWALVVATDKRLITVNKTLFSVRIDDIPYSAVSSIEHTTGLFTGRMKIFSRGNSIEMDRISLRLLREFVHTVECRIGMPDEQPSLSQIDPTPYIDTNPPTLINRPLVHISRRN